MGFKENDKKYPGNPLFRGKSIKNHPNCRQKAYEYIRKCPKTMSVGLDPVIKGSILPLDELPELKEGLSDPSPRMIMLLRRALGASISQSEIQNYLISPFVDNKHSVYNKLLL